MCPGGLLASTLCFCCSAAKSCLTLGNPMNCSTPGSSILHYLLVFAQTHVYWVSDAIQPSSVVPFSSCPQSFPTSGPFFSESVLHIRWPKDWSFRFSVSLSNEYSGLIFFKIDWFDLLAVQGTVKSLFQHHNLKALILRRSTISMVQLSHLYMTTGKTIALTIQTFISKGMSLLFDMLSRFVMAFLPGSKRFLISQLQSLSAVISEPEKIKSV